LKIAFVSDKCFLHCDENIIPQLIQYFTIGWFPFFLRDDNIETISKIEKFAQDNTLSLSYTEAGRRYKNIYTGISLYKHLLNVKKWQPDIIYINAGAFPWLPLLCFILFPKNKCIWAVHDVIPHSSSNKREYISAFFIRRLFDNYHLLSEYQYNLFKKTRHGKAVYFAPHPLCEYDTKDMIALYLDTNKIHFLFFGRIEEYKGLDLLINAAEYAYQKIGDKFNMIIAGFGEFERYRRLIKNQNIFIIKNHKIPDNEVASLFLSSHYLMLPYKDATQSGPMHIALNYGMPIFVSDIDAFKCYVNEFQNIISIPSSVKEWGEKIIQCCTTDYKPKRIDISEYKQKIIKAYINMFYNVFNK
jgi:glycosyltransferase involved in cell wall biosynthesis